MLKYYNKAHFVVYSNDVEPFRVNGEAYCESALRAGFDTATHYREEDLRETPFWIENAGILEQKRGAGYWLWKPYLVLKKLREVGPNDIVVYNDIGRYKPGSFEPFPQLPLAAMNLTAILPKRFLHGFKTDWLVQGNYTKRDCFIALDADTEEMHRASQVSGCPLFYMPSPESFELLETWLEMAKDPAVLTDIPDTKGDPLPEFQDHRHDMAIASILLHKTKGHYIDISKDVGAIYAEDVRRRNHSVPRIPTHAGYMSLMIARALPDDFFMRDSPDINLASTIIRNLTDDETVPVHQKVTSRAALAEEFGVMLQLKQTVITSAHLTAVLSDNRIVSSKAHALSKMPDDQTVAFWGDAVDAAHGLLVTFYEEGHEVERTTARDIALQAFHAAEMAHLDLRVETMIDVIWGALNEDSRGLFKGAHNNPKGQRGRVAMRQFITDSDYDILLPRDSELTGRYQDQAQHISDMMIAWLVDPAATPKA